MAKAIESLFDFEKNNIRTFEKYGTHFINLDDFLNYLKADKAQAQELIDENFIIKNSLNFNTDPDEGIYIEEKGLYVLMFNLESPLPEMRVYKMKCYDLFYEKMKNMDFLQGEN